jgi:single-stranded-DNA-specific exonuclease
MPEAPRSVRPEWRSVAVTERAVEVAPRLKETLSPRLARIFSARGVRDPAELDLSLPGLLAPEPLPGIEEGARVLADVLEAGGHVKIVGDFDADGATSCALVMLALRAMGGERVTFLVPNRFEFGYGLSPEIVAVALEDAPDVIVTVDNGMSSLEGVAVARRAGVRVVVTDHHLPGRELPAADAIVNPNLAGSAFESHALAGVGVAFYVMSALRAELRRRDWFTRRSLAEPALADLLDLVALGTVADVVPLDRNNRILVQQGLRRIRAGRARPGIAALCEVSRRAPHKLEAADLAFAIGPRLNAAGRLDDMSIGIRCLLADDLTEARRLANALEQLNLARRELETQMTREAELIVAGLRIEGTPAGLCTYDPGWHPGVVGIVAGRLRARFHRPAVAFADAGAHFPDEIRGSARSVPGVHVRDAIDAIATRYPGLVQKFGGHAMAAGVTLRRHHFERFARAFADEVTRWVPEESLRGVLESDGVLAADELVLGLAREIAAAGPWGQGFPEPCFHGEFDVLHQRLVGERHTRLSLRTGHRVVDAIAFNRPPLEAASRCLAVYRLGVNDWSERETLQLVIEHIEPCG